MAAGELTGEMIEELAPELARRNVLQRCYSSTVDYLIEALEAGVIQLIFLFVLPLMLSINILLSMLTAALQPEPPFVAYGHPPAAPPPPPPPDAVAVRMEELFDFAFDHPAIYFLCNFAIFLAIALFFLFLEDINKWREVRAPHRPNPSLAQTLSATRLACTPHISLSLIGSSPHPSLSLSLARCPALLHSTLTRVPSSSLA